MLLPPPIDGTTYVLTSQAAEIAGVAVPTISRWKARGWLTPVPESPPGKPIYRVEDVRAAEQTARENYLKSHANSDAQVRRLRGVGADGAW